MLFTKIWTAVLAVLATVCLAGMYLLSTGAGGKFTEADKIAVRAVTEAGMAALASDVHGSPVALGPALLTDTRLQLALDPPPVDPPKWQPPSDDDGFEETPEQALVRVFEEVANESLLAEHPLMSVALVGKDGAIIATTGLAPQLFDELAALPPMSDALKSEDAPLLSATLGGKLHAIKVSRPASDARRLVAIQVVELGGGSFFRRVVGTGNPAGLVRGKELIGDPIGGAKVEDLTACVEGHLADIPPEGASTVFEFGEGGSTRIGSAARVPGPAGKDKDPNGKAQDATVFVVLSAHDLASTQQDMATALSSALNEGGLAKLNWPLVGGLLLISLVLTFYLPHIEFTSPMKRLRSELESLTEGRKHQIDHDTYGGTIGAVGRGISAALEGQRLLLDAALVDSDADPGTARRTRGTRALRTTRSGAQRKPSAAHQTVEPSASASSSQDDDDEGIELRPAGGAEIERHASAEQPARVPARPPAAPVAAPAFHETPEPIEHLDSDAITLDVASGGGVDREAYYQQIFAEFVETKTACGESVEGFTYDKFAKKLRKQSSDLMARGDVRDVEFSVYVKDGKAALRAKVIKA